MLFIFLAFCVVFSVYVLFVVVLCLVCPLLTVSLDCTFFIAPSGFSNVYWFQFVELFCMIAEMSFALLKITVIEDSIEISVN